MDYQRPGPRFLTYILFVCGCGVALAWAAAADAPDWLVALLFLILVLGSSAQRLFPPIGKLFPPIGRRKRN